MSNALRRHHRMQPRNARIYLTKHDIDERQGRMRQREQNALKAHRIRKATGRTLKVA